MTTDPTPLRPDQYHEIDVPRATCPHCASVHDHALQTTTNSPLSAGAVMICTECLRLIERTASGGLARVPEGRQFELWMSPQARHLDRMLAYAATIREHRRMREAKRGEPWAP